jgi:AcrR family transcriptional regulator
MSSPVKPRRRYDASRRQEQARRSRWAVLQAARRLFLEHGYAATTMPAIATAAGVSVQSVYKAFGNKPALLKTVFDVAIAGDDEPVPMLQRAALGRIRAEPDPRRKLSLYGEFVAEVSPRHVSNCSPAPPPPPTRRRPASGTNCRQNDWRAWACSPVPCTRRATCAQTSRWTRHATSSGPTTRRNSTTCSCSNAAGHPNGTAAGSPTR